MHGISLLCDLSRWVAAVDLSWESRQNQGHDDHDRGVLGHEDEHAQDLEMQDDTGFLFTWLQCVLRTQDEC